MYLMVEGETRPDQEKVDAELPHSAFHTDPRKIAWRRRTLAALRKGHRR